LHSFYCSPQIDRKQNEGYCRFNNSEILPSSSSHFRIPYCLGGQILSHDIEASRRATTKTEWLVSIHYDSDDVNWAEKPTVVLIHGFKDFVNPNSTACCEKIGKTFKKFHDVNLVHVKWRNGNWYGYQSAVQAVEKIGRKIGKFLIDKLEEDYFRWKNLTIVGADVGGNEMLLKGL
jgi:hypothetical protein